MNAVHAIRTRAAITSDPPDRIEDVCYEAHETCLRSHRSVHAGIFVLLQQISSKRSMKYQLVLQWATPFPIRNLDDVVAIEDLLREELPASDEVDGHDFGSGEANVFIYTDRPERAFSVLQPVLAARNLLSHTCAAYRAVDQDQYTPVAHRLGCLLHQVAIPVRAVGLPSMWDPRSVTADELRRSKLWLLERPRLPVINVLQSDSCRFENRIDFSGAHRNLADFAIW